MVRGGNSFYTGTRERPRDCVSLSPHALPAVATSLHAWEVCVTLPGNPKRLEHGDRACRKDAEVACEPAACVKSAGQLTNLGMRNAR